MKEIKGIIPAVITPMNGDESISRSGLEAVIERVLAGGVHGVFAVGSTGEFYALSADEKKTLYRWTVETVRGRVPVYAGTAANTTREAVALTRAAEDAGADFVSVLTPSFIRPTDEELYGHYAGVARATARGVVLYGNPARTGVHLSPELVERLADEFENVVGIKDSSGDLSLTAEYVRRTPERFSVIAGRDTLIYATLAVGGRAAIAASANICPKLVVQVYEAFCAGELKRARRAQERLAPLRRAFSLGTFPGVLKEGAEIVGLPAGPCRKPVGRLPAEKRRELERLIASTL